MNEYDYFVRFRVGCRASYRGNYGVVTEIKPASANNRTLITLTYDAPVNSGARCGCHKNGHLYKAVHTTSDKLKLHHTL